MNNHTTTAPATEKQIAFLQKLAAERPSWADVENLHPDVINRLNRSDASYFIDLALKVGKEIGAAKPAAAAPADEGMYRIPETGEIFKVQRAVHGSGRNYAKKLIPIEGYSFEAHGKKTHEFVIARGMVFKLKPEHRMTVEEAKAWGALYGSCCVCGRVLTKEESIADGIGPVCAARV